MVITMAKLFQTEEIKGRRAVIKLKPLLINISSFTEDFLENKDVLDIGCVDMFSAIKDYESYIRTDKFLHKRIKNISKSVIGVDINQDGINVLQNNGYNVIRCNLMNDDIILLKDYKFDVVVLSHVLEHIDNIYAFLERITKHLSFHYVLIGLPNSYSLTSLLSVLILNQETVSNDHFYGFTPITGIKFVESAGLHVEKVYISKQNFSLKLGKKFKILGLLRNLIVPLFPYGDILIVAKKL